jgi:hypothetical protein
MPAVKARVRRRSMLFVKNRLIRAVSLLLFASAGTLLGQKPASAPTRNSGVPIFAERGDSVSIDPMMLIDGQQIRPVPNPCTETPALREFENQYLRAGATYPVIFGGVQRGTVSVTKLEGEEWRVQMHSDVQIHGLTMALAVGSPSLGGSMGTRRSPTATEQKHVEQMARELMKTNGVPAPSLNRMRVTQATAAVLNHSLKLIASVAVERPDDLGMEYSLFFVSDPVSDEKSTIWFQKPKSETDAEALYLIDLLVAANSGDRMLVRRVFYENDKYEVYKNRNGRWTKEFASEVFGCL